MKNLIRLTDYSINDITNIFTIADRISQGEFKDFLTDRTILLFFPAASIRTRVTFEKGIQQLGGNTILFPSDALDKKEAIKDVIGYLNNWADGIIVRHNDITKLDEMARHSTVPVINAMTGVNHPCEVLSDLYSLSKRRTDYLEAKYLFIGEKGNIGLAWQEASKVLGFSLTQSCPVGYEMDHIPVEYDIHKAVQGKDIILTDSLRKEMIKEFNNYQVTLTLLDKANPNVLFNPCPPFFRGEEVTDEVIQSEYFVGYQFKSTLIEIQQAIIIYNMMS
jgi:ornithine carbamoyltransferase